MNEQIYNNSGKGGAYASDLACERRRVDTDTPGVSYKRIQNGAFVWERIAISPSLDEISIRSHTNAPF